MRLLHLQEDNRYGIVEYVGDNIPRYAILSHTWGADSEEVTYQDLVNNTKNLADYHKLNFCGGQAAKDDLTFFWVDTCCIDKSSSSELSEAINSMFRWYQNADRCYVYLSDVSKPIENSENRSEQRWKPAFKKSKWFKRGWTLQELIAPVSVEFFSKEGAFLGTKQSLEQSIHEVTGIAITALRGMPLPQFSSEERMSWADNRQTKRKEDAAYCLLGIFDVHMPLIYGEGRKKALKRLQKEIQAGPSDKELAIIETQKRVLLQSLGFSQIDARHSNIAINHAKTCEWLLQKPEYLDWLDPAKFNEHHGFLWIKGKPGTGKSTLMKFAVDNALQSMTDNVIISFFFNARGEEIEKSTIGMYRSLLLQLLERLPRLQIVFDSPDFSSLSFSEDYLHVWSIEPLKRLLKQAIKFLENDSVVCFIDALDECEESQIRDMIHFFEQIGNYTPTAEAGFRVCLSSRHYPHITIRNSVSLILEGQDGHDRDIAHYLDSELSIGQSTVAQEIRSELQNKASGIFMWIILVVSILNKEYDRGRIHVLRKRLHEIPGDLYELFRDILSRDSQDRDRMTLCIQWVLFAKQPLSPEELYFAILSGDDPEALAAWDIEEATADVIRRFILDSSKGLTETSVFETFTRHNESPIVFERVQFIHESIRDFLLKEGGLSNIWPEYRSNIHGQSHEKLKQCCQNYLNTDGLATLGGPEISLKASYEEANRFRQGVRRSFPFLEYAISNVLYHAENAGISHIRQDMFLENFPRRQWVEMDNLMEKDQARRHTKNVSLLYILAEHNAPALISQYKSAYRCLDVETDRYGTPFFAALALGALQAAQSLHRILSERENCDNCKNTVVPAPQLGSTGDSEWNERLSNNLLEPIGFGSKPSVAGNRDFRYSKRRGFLSCAAEFGHQGLVAFLVEHRDYKIDARDTEGRTPLWWAAKTESVTVLNWLLRTSKVNVNAKDKQGCTLLHTAARHGRKAAVKVLLGAIDIVVDAANHYGHTPLSCAALAGHRSVVETLLTSGKADVNTRTQNGYTPLMCAVRYSQYDVAEVLLNTGHVQFDLTNRSGRTALDLAADYGSERVIKLLEAHRNQLGTIDGGVAL